VLGHRPGADPLRGSGGGLAGEMDRVTGEEDGHLVAFLGRGSRDEQTERRTRRVLGPRRHVYQDPRHADIVE
jgi:hypothetical protein